MPSKALKSKLLKRKKEIKERSEGRPYQTFKDGETIRGRVCRTKDPDAEFGVEVTTFWLGPDNGGLVISPSSLGMKCPFMEYHTKNKGSKDSVKKEIAEKLAPKKRYLVPHIIYSDEKGKKPDTDKSPRLFLLTPGQYQALIDMFLEDEKGDFTDPKTGYDIKYSRNGTGKTDTEYTTMDCKPSPVPIKYKNLTVDPEAMVKEILSTYDELEELLNQFIGNYDGDEEEEEDEPRRPAKKSSKKKLGKKKIKVRKGDDA